MARVMGHIHELNDFVVTIFLVHTDKVLLVHHKRYNLWLPIGGHIELDEDPEQALWREIEEETSLTESEVKILSGKPKEKFKTQKFLLTPNYLDIHDIDAKHKHIGLTYFARTTTDKVKLSDEHYEMAWLSGEEVESEKVELREQVKFYALEALQAAAGA